MAKKKPKGPWFRVYVGTERANKILRGSHDKGHAIQLATEYVLTPNQGPRVARVIEIDGPTEEEIFRMAGNVMVTHGS